MQTLPCVTINLVCLAYNYNQKGFWLRISKMFIIPLRVSVNIPCRSADRSFFLDLSLCLHLIVNLFSRLIPVAKDFQTAPFSPSLLWQQCEDEIPAHMSFTLVLDLACRQKAVAEVVVTLTHPHQNPAL